MPFDYVVPSPLGTRMDPWTGSEPPTSEDLEKPYEKGKVPKTNEKGEPYYHLKSGIRKRNVWTTNKDGSYMHNDRSIDKSYPRWKAILSFAFGISGVLTTWAISVSFIAGIWYVLPLWAKYWLIMFVIYKKLFTPCPYTKVDVPVSKCAKDWGKRVCVVGCGASGLAVCKELKEVTDDFVCYERRETHGGVFSKIYPFYMTSSSQTTAFWTDWPQPHLLDPIYWTSDQYCDYMRTVLDGCGVTPHVRYNHDVIGIAFTDDQNKIEVTVKNNETGIVTKEIFDHVIIASGHAAFPRTHIESIPGLKTNFQGDFHYGYDIDASHEEYYRGKNIIMCGGGEYGAHMASSIAPLAKNFYIAIRSMPGHLLCRYLKWDEPREEVPQVDRWLCANVDYNFSWSFFYSMNRYYATSLRAVSYFFAKHFMVNDLGKHHVHLRRLHEINKYSDGRRRYGTKAAGLVLATGVYGAKMCGQIMEVDTNNVVHTEDGLELENIDCIVACTGQTHDFPHWILDQEILDKLGSHRDRMFHVLHPELGSKLMFCGFQRPMVGSIPSLSETSARFIARVISGCLETPSKETILANVEKWKLYHLDLMGIHQTYTIPALVDWLWAQKQMTEYMGNFINIYDLFWYDTALWLQWQLAASNNIMWRLIGPGSKAEAHKRLRIHPRGTAFIQITSLFGIMWSWIESNTIGAINRFRTSGHKFGYGSGALTHEVDEFYQKKKLGIDERDWLY